GAGGSRAASTWPPSTPPSSRPSRPATSERRAALSAPISPPDGRSRSKRSTGPADAAGAPAEQPGEFPFTRGPYADMYRGRPWTSRQYAGFGSAEETNARFRYLLERGQTGLS